LGATNRSTRFSPSTAMRRELNGDNFLCGPPCRSESASIRPRILTSYLVETTLSHYHHGDVLRWGRTRGR
jgi:hypothetical protein